MKDTKISYNAKKLHNYYNGESIQSLNNDIKDEILLVIARSGMTKREDILIDVSNALNIYSNEIKSNFDSCLKDLVADGKIVRVDNGYYNKK